MKICHLCLHGPYNEGWNYQENILPKYHARLGYEVFQIVTPYIWDGNEIRECVDTRYTNTYGITVIRCHERTGISFGGRLERYPELMGFLQEITPDILFIHDVQCLDIATVVKFLKKHIDCIVYVDNHSDCVNSATNWLSKNILHKGLWKHMAQKINPFVKKFYGVLPARVDFLVDLYKLPPEKCELLVMGADDEAVEAALKPEVRVNKRLEYGVADDDFVIVTGGKIDHNKPQVLTLMKAVNETADEHIKLIVFGSVSPELKDEFDKQISEYVKYVGWRKSEDIYSDFAAAELVAFPGLHSVLWEQAVGMGKPCAFKRIKGFEHIDLGGNCMFFERDDIEEYKRVIAESIKNIDSMKAVAEGQGKEMFSYKAIAKRTLEG